MASFFVSSTQSVHFFQHHQLELRTPEPRPEQKHRHPEPRKHRIHSLVFFTRYFFGTMRLFFEIFWIPPKGLPFVCFDIFQHNGCQKIPKPPPRYMLHFWHCDTVQKSHFKNIFRNFLKSPKCPP